MGSTSELGSIEREIYVEAAPEVVFEVVSSPEHVRRWWPDDADFDPEPGTAGSITFGEGPDRTVESFTVVESLPPRTFSFRWTHPAGQGATAGNSLLVTFELVPSGDGTLLRMTETGFREQGWEVAVLEQRYREHVEGWAYYLPRLVTYAGSLEVRP
ncbi:SRPBCC family protein [Isoptericola sp. NPDC060257]|uniref:SRPBCC family protein n=1 Tax=Isoptericola sp. NPDC060257 TaxID=3347087 RepID=UPI00365B5D6C